MAVDLSKYSRTELLQLSRDIEKQLERLDKEERKAALEAAERAAKEYGYSLSDLTSATAPKSSKKVNPPKYRNPEDPTQTWTGKGRRPEWIKTAEEKGVELSSLEIG
ncbi:H-NS family nucleoid-associated regulatory protein [Pelagovum pacificum]|uniref:H-NS histone family protein n=1 Tax=Pelagovum pacificum TaxID=2588711 RepID=A0A5C5G9S6_9RHOB|nr:H-NS histone family protein [Pelagovum pacificum]QQA42432.1 H-NS histone family protein [Pelagovum pacificum]TNY31515.1 H-NS histone family protein [Pelagovum pacificum]